MCVVSMVSDHYWDKWNKPFPYSPTVPYVPNEPYNWPNVEPAPKPDPIDYQRRIREITELLEKNGKIVNPLTQAEIDEFRALLARAREYDKANGEPDCNNDAKMKALKDLAALFGYKIEFV